MLCHKQADFFLLCGFTIEYSGYFAAVYDKDSVTKLGKYVKILADKYHGNNVFVLLGEEIVYHI